MEPGRLALSRSCCLAPHWRSGKTGPGNGSRACIRWPSMWGAGGLVMMVMMLVFWGVVIADLVLGVRWLARQGGGAKRLGAGSPAATRA